MAIQKLSETPQMELEYFEIVAEHNLSVVQSKAEGVSYRAFVAVVVEGTRLIDNILSIKYICSMTIEVLKSKIHRVTVTGADWIMGSNTIDPVLMDAADLIAGEKLMLSM